MAIDQAALNALTAAYGAQKADLDDQENRYRINYNTALEELKRKRAKQVTDSAVGMSDRGLQQSGIAAQQQVTQQADFARAQQEMSQQQALNLGTIARKRLEADAAYASQAPLL